MAGLTGAPLLASPLTNALARIPGAGSQPASRSSTHEWPRAGEPRALHHRGKGRQIQHSGTFHWSRINTRRPGAGCWSVSGLYSLATATRRVWEAATHCMVMCMCVWEASRNRSSRWRGVGHRKSSRPACCSMLRLTQGEDPGKLDSNSNASQPSRLCKRAATLCGMPRSLCLRPRHGQTHRRRHSRPDAALPWLCRQGQGPGVLPTTAPSDEASTWLGMVMRWAMAVPTTIPNRQPSPCCTAAILALPTAVLLAAAWKFCSHTEELHQVCCSQQ